MIVPTPPAVSDAMREAMFRAGADALRPVSTEGWSTHAKAELVIDAICPLIASEIARLRGQITGAIHGGKARAEAAEAETARLRAALEAADYLADRYKALWQGKTVRDLLEAEAAYGAASKAIARAALSSQEQADV